MPYDDASDPVFERFFGRHLEFSPNKEMAKRFMLSYSTYTRLNVQEQWTKWYNNTESRLDDIRADLNAFKESNSQPTPEQERYMKGVLFSLEENKAHLVKLERQIRDRGMMGECGSMELRVLATRAWGRAKSSLHSFY